MIERRGFLFEVQEVEREGCNKNHPLHMPTWEFKGTGEGYKRKV
jgi:hypothetical protein